MHPNKPDLACSSFLTITNTTHDPSKACNRGAHVILFLTFAVLPFPRRSTHPLLESGAATPHRDTAFCQTSLHVPAMPLAERDINTQHHLHLTRCKRLPAAASVTDENATLSPTTPRAKDSPTHQQRFLAPTKASVAKNTPPPSADRARVQPPSSKSISSPHGSKLPRRNAATPTPKSPLFPPVSKWNRCVATDCIEDSTSHSRPPSSSYISTLGGTANDSPLVRRNSPSRALTITHMQ